MKSTQTSVQIVNFSKEHGKQGSTDSHGDAVLPKGVVGIQCSLNGYPSRHHDNQKHLKPGDEVIAHLTQVKRVYIMYRKSFKLASDSLSLCLSFSLSFTRHRCHFHTIEHVLFDIHLKNLSLKRKIYLV